MPIDRRMDKEDVVHTYTIRYIHVCGTYMYIHIMWYIIFHTMEYYSAIKRNEIGSFVETWMDLETVIQSEVSQKEKNKYRILTHVCGI